MALIRSIRSCLALAAATGLVLLTAGPAVKAQSEWNLMNDPTMERGSLFGFRSTRRIAPAPEEQMRAPVRRVLRQTSGPLASDLAKAVPKVDPTAFVVVLGDTLGEMLAGGLDEALGDVPHATVIRKTRAESGLVRNDVYDWTRAVRELLDSTQKMSLGVFLVGSNDRQPIREGDLSHEPLSERWRELYRDRIDLIAQAFSDRKVPLIWVGAPPMQNARLSADLAVINEMFRQRVERSGGIYVDLWSAFVDGESRYTATGPDLSGQVARLRTGDGVHFTRAGARKAAHFADVALRRLLPEVSAGPVLAAPGPVVPLPEGVPLPLELQPGGIERIIDRMVRANLGLDLPAEPVVRVKPLAGPVLPLTGPATASGGQLVPTLAAARGSGPQARDLERVFGDGRSAPPPAGRADDFRWPRLQPAP